MEWRQNDSSGAFDNLFIIFWEKELKTIETETHSKLDRRDSLNRMREHQVQRSTDKGIT